jgi:hypothetical protein
MELNSRLLALHTNNRQADKRLAMVKNNLAYLCKVSVTKEKKVL